MSRRLNDDYPTHAGLLLPLLQLRKRNGAPLISGSVLEPAAGAGSLASLLRPTVSEVYTNDILWGTILWKCGICGAENLHSMEYEHDYPQGNECPKCGEEFRDDDLENVGTKWLERIDYNCNYHVDASKLKSWWDTFPVVDWVVTNPPYTTGVLEKVLEASLAYVRHGVAMLLRLSAMEPVIKRGTRGHILQSYADCMRYLMPFSDPRPRYDRTKKGTDSVTTAWFVWDKGWSWKQNGMESPFQFVTGWLDKE